MLNKGGEEEEVVERISEKKWELRKLEKNQERLVKQWEKEGARLFYQ